MPRFAAADAARNASPSPALSDQLPTDAAVCRAVLLRRIFGAIGLLLCCLTITLGATAQSPAPSTTSPIPTPKSVPSAQPIPRVTTTVVVQGETADEYLPDAVTVGNLDGIPLTETPLSATVVTRDLLNDQDARLLSDVVKNDASIGEDYAPVGYYGDYEIRGFTIDLATGL